MSNYSKVLVNLNNKVNQALNNAMNIYDDKLKQISMLMKTGQTNPEIAGVINKNLINALIDIRTKNMDQSPIVVKKATSSIIDSLFLKLSEKLDITDQSNSQDFFDYFKNEMHELFLSFEGESISDKSLIQIQLPELKDNHDFNELVNNYIKNYIKVLNGDESISWDEDHLHSYITQIEYKVYVKTKMPSDITLQIFNAIDEESWDILSFAKNNLNKTNKEELKKKINIFLQGLIDGNKYNTIDQILYQFKTTIIQHVTSLFELTNAELFPKLMKKTIDLMNQKDQGIVDKLTEQINDLDNKRHQVIEEVKNEKLYEFNSDSFISKEELQNSISVRNAVDNVYRLQGSPFSLFMEQRNEKSKIINFQLSNEDGAYISIFEKIKKEIQVSENSTIITYFATSIESLAMELKKSCLKSLGMTMQLFINQNKNIFGEELQSDLREVEAEQKIQFITVISNMRSKLDGLTANNIYGELQMKVHVMEYFQDSGPRVFFNDVIKIIEESIDLSSADKALITTHIEFLSEVNPAFKINFSVGQAVIPLSFLALIAAMIPWGGQAIAGGAVLGAMASFGSDAVGSVDATNSQKERILIDHIGDILAKLKSYLIINE